MSLWDFQEAHDCWKQSAPVSAHRLQGAFQNLLRIWCFLHREEHRPRSPLQVCYPMRKGGKISSSQRVIPCRAALPQTVSGQEPQSVPIQLFPRLPIEIGFSQPP